MLGWSRAALAMKSVPVSPSESRTFTIQMYGTRSHFKCQTRFWESSPWSQNTFRTVYLSSLVVCQTTRCSCTPGALLVLEGFLVFCLYSYHGLDSGIGAPLPVLYVCSHWLERIFSCFSKTTNVKVILIPFQGPLPRSAVGVGQDSVLALSWVCLDHRKYHPWALLASVQPHSFSGRWDLSSAFINMFCLTLCSSHRVAAVWKWAYCSENWVKFHSLVLCRRSDGMSVT